MPINLEKIRKEIDKSESIEETIKAYYELKQYISTLVEAAQKTAEEKANELQGTLDKINNQ